MKLCYLIFTLVVTIYGIEYSRHHHHHGLYKNPKAFASSLNKIDLIAMIQGLVDDGETERDSIQAVRDAALDDFNTKEAARVAAATAEESARTTLEQGEADLIDKIKERDDWNVIQTDSAKVVINATIDKDAALAEKDIQIVVDHLIAMIEGLIDDGEDERSSYIDVWNAAQDDFDTKEAARVAAANAEESARTTLEQGEADLIDRIKERDDWNVIQTDSAQVVINATIDEAAALAEKDMQSARIDDHAATLNEVRDVIAELTSDGGKALAEINQERKLLVVDYKALVSADPYLIDEIIDLVDDLLTDGEVERATYVDAWATAQQILNDAQAVHDDNFRNYEVYKGLVDRQKLHNAGFKADHDIKVDELAAATTLRNSANDNTKEAARVAAATAEESARTTLEQGESDLIDMIKERDDWNVIQTDSAEVVIKATVDRDAALAEEDIQTARIDRHAATLNKVRAVIAEINGKALAEINEGRKLLALDYKAFTSADPEKIDEIIDLIDELLAAGETERATYVDAWATANQILNDAQAVHDDNWRNYEIHKGLVDRQELDNASFKADHDIKVDELAAATTLRDSANDELEIQIARLAAENERIDFEQGKYLSIMAKLEGLFP